jgi:hypothetical protein
MGHGGVRHAGAGRAAGPCVHTEAGRAAAGRRHGINARPLLLAPPNPRPGDAQGPDTELEYWRLRMAKLNSLAEQLKGREARIVLGTCHVMHSPSAKRWKVGVGGGAPLRPRGCCALASQLASQRAPRRAGR